MKLVFKVLGMVIFLSTNKVSGNARLHTIENNILKSLLKEYDPNKLPTGGKNGTGPVEVEVNTYVRQMGGFDDTKMVYDVQLTFRQEWRDDRLKYDTVEDLSYLTVAREGVIWVPDLFFSNEDSGHNHNIIKPNILIRIYPNGLILYSTRISLNLFCKMDLHNYPLDNQVCNIVFASYAYTSSNITFFWKEMNGIQVSSNLKLRKFKLNAFSLNDCSSVTTTGSYSCLMAKFFLTRNVQTFLKDVYIPTTSLVLLCSVVFWLHPKSSVIRFGIWFGTLITMYMLLISLGFKTPETPYTKAIDIWTGSCLTFIYLVGIELCLVKKAVENKDDDDLEEERNSTKLEDPQIHKRLQRYFVVPLRWYKSSSKPHRIDVIFRVLYPLTFVFFTLFYWIAYSEKQNLCEGGGYCYEL